MLDEGELLPDRRTRSATPWKDRTSRRTADGGPHPDMQLNLINARLSTLIAGGDEHRRTLAGDQLHVDLDLSDGQPPPPAPAWPSATRRRHRDHRPAPHRVRQVRRPVRARGPAVRERRRGQGPAAAGHQRPGGRCPAPSGPATRSGSSRRPPTTFAGGGARPPRAPTGPSSRRRSSRNRTASPTARPGPRSRIRITCVAVEVGPDRRQLLLLPEPGDALLEGVHAAWSMPGLALVAGGAVAPGQLDQLGRGGRRRPARSGGRRRRSTRRRPPRSRGTAGGARRGGSRSSTTSLGSFRATSRCRAIRAPTTSWWWNMTPLGP